MGLAVGGGGGGRAGSCPPPPRYQFGEEAGLGPPPSLSPAVWGGAGTPGRGDWEVSSLGGALSPAWGFPAPGRGGGFVLGRGGGCPRSALPASRCQLEATPRPLFRFPSRYWLPGQEVSQGERWGRGVPPNGARRLGRGGRAVGWGGRGAARGGGERGGVCEGGPTAGGRGALVQ